RGADAAASVGRSCWPRSPLVHAEQPDSKLRSAPSPLCSSCAVNMDEFTSAGFTTGIKMLKALVVGFVFTAIAFLSPRRSGNRTTPSHYWRCAYTLACRATPRLSCCWSSVAARPLPLESAVGSVVGCACGAFAIRPSPRAAAWSDRSSSFRRASLERLAASDIRPNSLCCCCRVGWVAAPALHHAPHRASADLGFHPCPDRARVCHPLLVRAARAAAACSAIRIS